ncbi:Sn1-specific diacylglycerol lipase alpha [Hypsizygus marmoreus]|uniref:sn-1-specific diacylglycerol lipase n=1 Tax=Hypsizygus marmoreus TaxID=39966 RepID=A0A369J493_HYPMA|nr:Sn1-specific diacylglycerol lipase alpha [Hypsizygus marmoreus]
MVKNWDTYGRQGLDLASTATSFGFNAVKAGTRFGFAVTRGIAGAAVGITTTIVDHAIFGGTTVTRPVLGGAVSTVISLAEQLTLAPIFLSEYVTSTSLIAAHSSINVLSVIFPGSSDASFSLASFITLVRREWSEPAEGAIVPGRQHGITKIARAIVAWVALQGVTQEWQEKIWLKHLREIHVKDPTQRKTLSRRNSRVRVTSDIILPGNSGQLISADIGEAPPRSRAYSSASLRSRKFSVIPIPSNLTRRSRPIDPPRLSHSELKTTLRRLSKIVLAGYGGASLLFFGVSPYQRSRTTSSAAEMAQEEAQLAHAIDASEAEACGDYDPGADAEGNVPGVSEHYSWWDVLLGKHDQEIFERAAGVGTPGRKAEEEIKRKMSATAVIGIEHMMPRFWVLTDHGRGQVVLVLRGTMSLNEIAADLTCDPEEFEPATSEGDEDEHLPGQYSFPAMNASQTSQASSAPRYHVHSGIARMTRAMGDVGKPVHLAVQVALYNNPDYELVMCGHSLGAGVAAILGMKWADPRTCLTTRSSGLPPGRRVFVYCFAPPALADSALSKLASRLIVSFVYSHDVVSRLSLGSVRDLKNAAAWLCEAEEEGEGEGWGAVTGRAKRWKAGTMSPEEDAQWFIAMRKTLEANMQMANMFPPGHILWAMRDSDLHPYHRTHPSGDVGRDEKEKDRLRLFEVLDVEKVFKQIVFARDMLSAHMPHQYDKVLHDLL